MVTTWGEQPILSATSRAIAIEVLVHGAQSRARLSERMGLSAGSVTRLAKPLLESGILVESESVRSSPRGRASLPLDVVVDDYRFIGVKLTAATAFAVVTDLRAKVLGKVSAELRSQDVSTVTETVIGLVDDLRRRGAGSCDAVGVTVGGQVASGSVVADSSYLHWREVPFRSILERALDTPVHLDNDVVALTKAQHWFGSGREPSNFAMLTVGAGIGYGLVINGELVTTELGPISHLPVAPWGPLCVLGHRGCLSAMLTTEAITGAVSLAHRREIGYEDVLGLAAEGDPAASRVLHDAALALGRAVASIGALTGVDRIILSGEGVHLAEVARESLDEGVTEYHAAPTRQDIVVHPVDFYEWARGAAVVAIQEEFPPRGENLAHRSAVPDAL